MKHWINSGKSFVTGQNSMSNVTDKINWRVNKQCQVLGKEEAAIK